MFKNRWWIAGASAVALIFSAGTIQLFSASLFIKPITEELGFGRGTLSTAFGINFVLSGRERHRCLCQVHAGRSRSLHSRRQ